MFDITQPFHGDPALPSPVLTVVSATETLLSFTDAGGTFLGQILVTTSGNTTLYAFFDASLTLLGSVSEYVAGDTTRITVFDAAGVELSSERIITRSDYTLHEHWDGSGAFLGAEKFIHTATTTGVQNYDAGWNLTSAHLEVTEPGRTQVADYGPNWFVIRRETTTVSGNVTTTVIEENGAGNITGGTRVTETADFTLVEHFGAGWVVTGYEKLIHTATTTGIQVYDGTDNLISAHLEITEPGRTQVADYGPNWFVIRRETTTVSGNVTTTVIEENGAGNITGGTRVTETAEFTLVETFGAGWVVTGAVKHIHTATTTGEQIYDSNWNLLAAHLVIIEGGRHVVEDYGPGWELISRLRTTTTDDKVVTEYLTGPSAVLQWRSIVYGDTPEFENRFEVFHGDGDFIGTGGRDSMIGNDGNDHFLGGDANDTLIGANGNDLLDGEADNDQLSGGRGEDTLLGGDGNDRIEGGADADTLDGGEGHDTLMGGSGDDEINGGDGNDVVQGGSGNDLIEGGAGNDTLQGNADDDTLSGGTGRDELKGGAGSDRLIATGDGDTLSGGADADTFVFVPATDTGTAMDEITDFDPGIDLIDLSAFASGGALTFMGEGAVLTIGAVYYELSGSDLILSLELDGLAGADLSIRIDNLASLSGSDLLLS